jgi:hypothetical protein
MPLRLRGFADFANYQLPEIDGRSARRNAASGVAFDGQEGATEKSRELVDPEREFGDDIQACASAALNRDGVLEGPILRCCCKRAKRPGANQSVGRGCRQPIDRDGRERRPAVRMLARRSKVASARSLPTRWVDSSARKSTPPMAKIAMVPRWSSAIWL